MSVPAVILDSVTPYSAQAGFPALSPVFVGREAELAALDDALDRAGRPDAAEPQSLLLGGEAGVGKTRLLEEFLARARDRGAVTATGGCLELGADGLPFAPFATALRGLHRALGDAELAAAAGGREQELARLLPDLTRPEPAPGTPWPDGPVPREPAYVSAHDEQEARARLFELTAQLLERLAGARTVVLAIEDLHWADRSTRELLGYLHRSVRSARLVLLATYRPDDIHRRHPLRPFLAELDRLRTVGRIELARLSRAGVRAQIAGIQGVPDPENALVETVFERSDGNPFFVEELTAHRGAHAQCGISDSLRDLLLVRVEALPDDAQHVLRIAAQGGSRVEHALLAAVCELPEDALLSALRAAVGANILLPTEDDEGYRFRHALLREAVSDDLLPGEGARLSRRYARALEADPSLVRAEERATRLAHHWYHGRDAARALPAVLAASVAARRRHAFAEQHHMLERAIELWHEVPEDVRDGLRPIDAAEVYPACAAEPGAESLVFTDLLAEAVVAARAGGELERALALTRRALDGIDGIGGQGVDGDRDPLRAAWFWMQRSRLTEDLGRGDGWDEIGRAQELVRGLPPSAVHAEVLAGAAGWGMMHHPGVDAMTTAVRAVELARTVGATTTRLQARITLGTLMADAGNLREGLAEMAAAREEALAAREFGIVARAGVNISAELENSGRSSEAAAAAALAARVALEHGQPNHASLALANQADSLLEMGEWQEAERLTGQATVEARSSLTRTWAALMTARLARLRGQSELAAAAAVTVREAAGMRMPPQSAIPLRHIELELAYGRGDFAAARVLLEEQLELGFPPGTHRHGWPLLHSAAVGEAELRGLPAAKAGRDELLGRLRQSARRLAHPSPVWAAYALLVRAELGRAEGRSAVDDWSEAATAMAGVERPYLLALVRHRWAEALVESDGDRARAGELLGQGRETAERLGAAPLVEEIAGLAERARLSLRDDCPAPEQTPDPEPFGLTRRERSVLRLVAAGRSNRQIAEELFISPKTASVHVSNILAKLEVSGRGEAAALAHRLGLR